MDDVPVATNRQAANSHHTQTAKSARKMSNMKRNGIIGGIVVILLLLGFGGWTLYQSSTGAVINSSEYQAVFFTNGQVYFGKLHTLNASYMTLTDIYYLQAQNSSSSNPQQTSSNSDVQLVKLGNEVHGPVDQMVINKDQVLFFENLKKDGKVSSSITKYQEGQKH